jgi:hypothetical protein
MPNHEELGFVTCRSGILIIIDTGYLNIWSHDQIPMLPDGSLNSASAVKHANSFVDLKIVGIDAEKAGRALEMSWHPLMVYDQPPLHPELRKKFDEIIHRNQLSAELEVLTPRIAHRKRVNLALEQGHGAGEVQFHGVWASVIGSVPTSRALKVLGERMTGNDSDRWKRVIVQCNPGKKIENSEMVGCVGVDFARLLIADVDCLGSWEHHKSLDGLADFVFWGRDAKVIAEAINAPALAQEQFGWRDISEDLAQSRGHSVEEYKERHDLKLATDYRPHSHHWRVMEPTRNSPTESAVTDVDGITVCNFMTSWGDGLFDVYRDLSGSGELVQIRIELDQ